MNFKLNDYHRNVSDAELLNDVKRVADLYKTPNLTIEMYKKYGKYHRSTITRRFGSWKKVVKMIGLKHIHGALKNENNIEVTEEQLLEDLRNTALRLGLQTLTTTQYEENGKHGRHMIEKRFDTWESALTKAGLQPTGFRYSVSTQEVLEEIERLWVELGRQPTTTDIKNGLSRYSLNTYTRKFGGWRKALECFVKYIDCDKNEEENEVCFVVPERKPGEHHPVLTARKTKRDIGLRLRFLVMKRDNFKCCKCGRSPAISPGVILHVDHKKAWANGGETVMENLQTLCQDCNLGKSDMNDE